MNQKIANRLTRARHYHEQVVNAIRRRDTAQAMADCAELQYQAKALYNELQKFISETKQK